MLHPAVSVRESPVRYAGLLPSASRRFDVFAAQTVHFEAKAGDLITVHAVDGGATLLLSSLPSTAPQLTTKPLSAHGQALRVTLKSVETLYDPRTLNALLASRGAAQQQAEALALFDPATKPGDIFTIRMIEDALVVAIAPLSRDYLTQGGGGQFTIDHQPNNDASDRLAVLPDPLGKVLDEFIVPRATARAYELKRGQFVQIMDVEGRQCSDFMAMRSSALERGIERHIDSTVSRTMDHAAYPQPGLHDKFYDQDFTPLLAVRQDTVGRHDTFALACTARGYENRGFPGHINCSDNISDVYAPFGIAPRRAWPAINFFFNSTIDDGTHLLSSDEAWSRPGDYVAMEALTDLVCVSTACPDDVDPINGWNPTDILVRIYEKDTAIRQAVSFRTEPEATTRMTRHSPFHDRTSKRTQSFAVAQDVWLPTVYDATGAIQEYWACKEAATLQDMSSLRKFDILGPDAETLLQHCMTRNIAKLSEHRGMYALMCDERGAVIDDGTLFRLETNAFRWCCGSEHSALHLREQAESLGLRVFVKPLSEHLANLALQGPKSRDILRKIVFTQPNRPSLDNIKWFGFTIARLHDRDGPLFMLTRTGFTGELGYEIFCDAADAEAIWDSIMDAGAPDGLVPMGGDALAMLRIEAGLMTAGAEFGPDSDALEAGLGFAVDFNKGPFHGRAALERNKSAIRRELVGLIFKGNDCPSHGDPVFLGRNQVGTITSATPSPQLGHAIAMARIAVENAALGTQLEVGQLDGHVKRLPCSTTSLPFLDAKREKARA